MYYSKLFETSFYEGEMQASCSAVANYFTTAIKTAI